VEDESAARIKGEADRAAAALFPEINIRWSIGWGKTIGPVLEFKTDASMTLGM
jgi:hypothetical protein